MSTLHYFHLFCTLCAVPTLLYKLYSLCRSPRDPALRALCAVMTFSVLSLALLQSTVFALLADLTGWPYTASVLFQLDVMALVTSQQISLARWNYPPAQAKRKARLYIISAVAWQVVLVALFLCLVYAGRAHADFRLRYTLFVLYLLAYTSVYSLGALRVARQSRRLARLSHRLWLRRGLNLSAAGAVITIGYSLSQLGSLSARVSSGWSDLTWMCGDTGTLLTLIGWTLPGWGPRLSVLKYRLHIHRQHRRLENLWKALSDAAPSITLTDPGFTLREGLRTRTAEFRLYRRIIEIRDGLLMLAPHLDSTVRQEAERAGRDGGLTGDELRAAILAAQIATALHTSRPLPQRSTQGARSVSEPDQMNVLQEATWLTQVAAALDHSPTVHRVLHAQRHRADSVSAQA
jgi:hypothetical protein